MQVVRAVGNTLNASTFRGNARGFQLDALLKVSIHTCPLSTDKLTQ